MMGLWNTFGSTIASFMFVWAIISRYFPIELIPYLDSYKNRLLGLFNPYIQISIYDDFPGKAFSCVEAYLSANSSKNANRLKVEVGINSKKLMLTMDDHEQVSDNFNGVQVSWVLSAKVAPLRSNLKYPEPDRRYYTLMFHRKHREMITQNYLEHVLKKGKEIKRQNRQRLLYTNNKANQYLSLKMSWSHIVYKHPATFETLAMEPDKKQEIIEDLLTFSKSKDYYARIGKSCKRGYLLYGPPGTGKSTMIAAMANLLNYDIYDLELTAVMNNTELRMLLTQTTSKSIIVIEDIDCSLYLSGQRIKKEEEHPYTYKLMNVASKESKDDSKVTLSGLLNFIDGLWSACGGKRIIVLTTNYVEKLDPALIRTGRMDKHVEMSYCSFEGFKVLAKNYLEVEAHPTFDLIQQLMKEVNITPADVAEKLMPKTAAKNADICLSNLIRALDEVKEDLKRKELAKAEAKSSDKQKEPVKVEVNK